MLPSRRSRLQLKATKMAAINASLTPDQVSTRQLLLALTKQNLPSQSRLKLDDIQYHGDRLISDGAAKILDHLDSWSLNCTEYQDILSLPSIDPLSPGATCIAYYGFLKEQLGNDTGCTSVARRIARVIFYLSFERFVLELEERDRSGELHKSRAGRSTSTVARDSILETFYPDEYRDASTNKQMSRNKLSGEIRYGQRWWRYASVIGPDALLTCPRDVALKMYVHAAGVTGSVKLLTSYPGTTILNWTIIHWMCSSTISRTLILALLSSSGCLIQSLNVFCQPTAFLSAQQWIISVVLVAK